MAILKPHIFNYHNTKLPHFTPLALYLYRLLAKVEGANTMWYDEGAPRQVDRPVVGNRCLIGNGETVAFTGVAGNLSIAVYERNGTWQEITVASGINQSTKVWTPIAGRAYKYAFVYDAAALHGIYLFEEGTSLTLIDISGNGNHATLSESSLRNTTIDVPALALSGDYSGISNVVESSSTDLSGATFEGYTSGSNNWVVKDAPGGSLIAPYEVQRNDHPNAQITGSNLYLERSGYGWSFSIARFYKSALPLGRWIIGATYRLLFDISSFSHPSGQNKVICRFWNSDTNQWEGVQNFTVTNGKVSYEFTATANGWGAGLLVGAHQVGGGQVSWANITNLRFELAGLTLPSEKDNKKVDALFGNPIQYQGRRDWPALSNGDGTFNLAYQYPFNRPAAWNNYTLGDTVPHLYHRVNDASFDRLCLFNSTPSTETLTRINQFTKSV